MADRTVFPTKDWQWPLDNLAGVEALTKEAEAALTLGGAIGAAVAQLRRDRDELVTALDAALRWVDTLGGKDLMNDKGDAREVLARIRG